MFQRGRREQSLDSSAEHDGGAAQQIAQADRRYRGGGLAQALGAPMLSSPALAVFASVTSPRAVAQVGGGAGRRALAPRCLPSRSASAHRTVRALVAPSTARFSPSARLTRHSSGLPPAVAQFQR